MYSIYGQTLAMALVTSWMVFTPLQPVPHPTPIDSHTLPRLPAAHAILWAQSEEPGSVELRVPTVLMNALRTEEPSNDETIDLRIPEILLEYLYGAEPNPTE
jgi:hypothetical protein